jgi:hypothetical protein
MEMEQELLCRLQVRPSRILFRTIPVFQSIFAEQLCFVRAGIKLVQNHDQRTAARA